MTACEFYDKQHYCFLPFSRILLIQCVHPMGLSFASLSSLLRGVLAAFDQPGDLSDRRYPHDLEEGVPLFTYVSMLIRIRKLGEK